MDVGHSKNMHAHCIKQKHMAETFNDKLMFQDSPPENDFYKILQEKNRISEKSQFLWEKSLA